MSKIKVNHPDRNPDFVTGAYSDGVIVDGFIFIIGQVTVDFKTSKFVLGTIEEKTTRTLNTIEAIVKAAAASMNNPEFIEWLAQKS